MLILQDGERFLQSVPANLFQGIMAVGGEIKITDRRLYFKPNEFNIGGQPQEIRFEHITEVKKGMNMGIIPNAIFVHTPMGKFKFVTHKRKLAFDGITAALAQFRAK